MTVVSLVGRLGAERSAFAGADVCMEAGLALAPGTPRPRFENDVWDLSGVVGLPVQMDPRHRRLEFAAIVNPAWRVVAKELVLALLARGIRPWRYWPGPRARHCTSAPAVLASSDSPRA